MISVIIPTHNRARLLEATLQSIQRQTLPHSEFEVLVIDNASTDGTRVIAERHIQSSSNMRYVFEPSPGLHAARHRGAKDSKGDILVYADDDIEATPPWLAEIRGAFEDPNVAMVGGKVLPKYEAAPPDWLNDAWDHVAEGKFITYFSLIDFGDSKLEIDPAYVFGCNFSIRKEILLQIKGFHPDAMPNNGILFRGDGETHVARMVKSSGQRTLYIPGAAIYHWVPASRMTKDYLIKRAFADGITKSFSDIRESGHADALYFLRPAYALLRNSFAGSLRRQIQKSFWKGYAFHQKEFRRNDSLRAWVLKDNYLEY